MNTRKLIEWSASICGAAVCVSAVLFLSATFHWRAYDGRSFPVPVRIQELVFLAVAACIPTAWFLFRRPSKETPDQSGLPRLTVGRYSFWWVRSCCSTYYA